MKKLLLLNCVVTIVAASLSQAEEPAKVDSKTYEQMVTKGIDYLKTKGQAPDGSYSAQAGPGVDALEAVIVVDDSVAEAADASVKIKIIFDEIDSFGHCCRTRARDSG